MIIPSTLKIYNASAGSGKTFFLVKNYLYILLKNRNSDEFKKILALTFTKKASEEMKKRILQCLKEFSNPIRIKKEYSYLLNNLIKDLNLTKQQLHRRSKKILSSIFHDFHSFSKNISTIDKFNYNIVRSFYSTKKIDLEMDTEKILFKVVDNLLCRLNNSEKWSDILVQFSIEKLREGKNWDLRKELFKMARIIMDENNFLPVKKIKSYSLENFVQLKNVLIKRTRKFEEKCETQGRKFFVFLRENYISEKSFLNSEFPKFFQKFKTKNILLNPFHENLENNIQKKIFYSKNSKKSQRILIEKNQNKIISLYNKTKSIYNNNISCYLLDKIFLRNINILSIIHEIEKELNFIKNEKRIILNIELNKIIYEKITKETFPKIYEKIGTKYKHYFIDEFQDISFLQWNNIKILIENALSENGSAMIVGDPKQSIYRWRGGDSKQFIKLINYKSINYKKELKTLEKNFRSYKEIVKFNNSLYKSISKIFRSHDYKNIYLNSKQKVFKKSGGYVEINFIKSLLVSNYKEHIYFQVKNKIEKLLRKKYLLSDISLLVRNNKEGHFLSERLIEDGFKVNTSVSLLIKNQLEIQIIINLFYIISNPYCYQKRVVLIFLLLRKKFLLTKKKYHDFIMEIIFFPLDIFLKKISLKNKFFVKKIYNKTIYSISEEIINSFELLNKNSTASIYSFLDFVYRFMKKKGNSIIDFLNYWESKKEKESVIISDNNKNSIHVMTIHKSKGLQFPIVILPFADWNSHSNNKRKKEGGWIDVNPHLYNGLNTIYLEIEPYLKQIKHNKEIHNFYKNYISNTMNDNINLLYVATTRPIEQLIFFSKLENEKTISFYIKNFLQEKKIWNDKKYQYSFGKEGKYF
ncbi:UvrD-helicase domain-containing protein [Blattabacterium cuenoti]|uniref:UvrD-helicase domain-containing protein n=1 Tax=Blattabacterium cuenoti TaxID=1653831 RepID=UPI00163B63D2|nr:UvrD-helicase domain-containing protein [Blattabacterium cuenoti]